ncbi:MAG: DUF1552 domain-containing protein [Myxococcaceae bacterium]|nr:DUF1552 domain-containing protein [Myxococcaceae bacterium]
MTFRLSRRTVLKGAGALVALPTLEAMLNSHGTAYAEGGAFPQRLLTWFFGNGVVLPMWTPSATGANYAFSPALSPLQNVKDYVNVVSGCNVKTPDLRGHHNGCGAMMSGYPFIPIPANGANYASKFGGPSIDQVAAGIIGTTTTFPSLQLAVSKRATTGEGPTLQYISHKGPDAPLPPEMNPAKLYQKLFGNFVEPSNPTDPRDALRLNVLDAVKDDANRLIKRLGAADRQRLDQHLTAISELRQQISALPPPVTSACAAPKTPVTQTNQDQGGAEPMEAVHRAFADLIALAWACDLTRVVSVQFSGSVADTAYPMIGIPDNEHDLSHDPSRKDDINRCVTFCVQNFAYLCERLKATPEGPGNLLDNSVLMMTTDVAEGWVHSIQDYPVVIAGRGGGVLKYPGIHYRSPNGRNTSDILLTVLRAAGTGVSSVGGAEGLSTTVISELMA